MASSRLAAFEPFGFPGDELVGLIGILDGHLHFRLSYLQDALSGTGSKCLLFVPIVYALPYTEPFPAPVSVQVGPVDLHGFSNHH